MTSTATPRAAEPRRAAFFDVDETLIATKSMFAFWDHWSARGGGGGRRTGDGEGAGDGKAAGDGEGGSRGASPTGDAPVPADRAALNRAHFRRYRGARPDELSAAGQEWYATYRTTPSAFVTASLSALRRHRAAGHAVVLVSGSADPMLRPLAEDLGAEAVLCTELLVGADGLLTGDVRTPMIGGAKATAVTAYLARHGLSADDSHAYGDHASDLDMLRAVGNPVVVGDDPELAHWAAREGWHRLPR
ncbi:HAD family hydrolase [Streptomyces formicae]|uniref:Phosphoserine phosphatase n=1 Tax=Streptomyces formicae TaxID=1616117 RepID=A0A291QH31_9ACTN|nr:HAD-IB family hydrolase [Streptomyces formicae]ATL31120.1 Phosphoserine phosphatase [Streptomyces formicae]